MKEAEIHLPYFKQGDDLGYHLTRCATVEEALNSHAEQLEYAAQILRRVRDIIAGQGVEIYADTHFIQVSGPDAIIDALIDTKYASRPVYEDDDEYEANDNAHEEKLTGWDSVF